MHIPSSELSSAAVSRQPVFAYTFVSCRERRVDIACSSNVAIFEHDGLGVGVPMEVLY